MCTQPKHTHTQKERLFWSPRPIVVAGLTSASRVKLFFNYSAITRVITWKLTYYGWLEREAKGKWGIESEK